MEMAQSLKKRLSAPQLLYYFSFCYLVLLSFIRMTSVTPTLSIPFFNRLSYLAIFLLLIKIFLLDHSNWRTLIWEGIIVLLAIISWRQTLAVDVLEMVLLILGARDIDFQLLMKIFFGMLFILLLYTIIISQVGIIKDQVYRRGHFYRHSLGNTYPTDFASHFFYLFLAYCYLFFEKLTWKSYLWIVIVGGLVFLVTDARTTFILTILLVPVFIVAKRAHEGFPISNVFASLYWFAPALTAYCTAIISYFYTSSNHVMRMLNKLVSTRLQLSHTAEMKYGITLFGQRIIEHGYGGNKGYKLFHTGMVKYFYIDSSWVRLAVIYGLLIGLFFIATMTLIAFRSTQYRDYALAAIILLISLHCIIEQHLLDVSFDPFMIALLAKSSYWENKDLRPISGKIGDTYYEHK